MKSGSRSIWKVAGSILHLHVKVSLSEFINSKVPVASLTAASAISVLMGEVFYSV